MNANRRVPGIRLGALLLVLTLLGGATQAFAEGPGEAPGSAQLVERPKEFDGRSIVFTGEVIGEAMLRGDHAWIHVNDDAYYLKNVEEGAPLGGYNSGMAVFVPAALVEDIGHYGDYKHEGDVVTVTGVFNAACPEHGGDMDIHAEELRIDAPGRHVADVVKPWKIWAAVCSSLLAALLFAWYRRMESTKFIAQGSRRA